MLETQEIDAGVRISLKIDGSEVGRAYLYILHNDLHKRPFGLMEDVFLDTQYRGKNHGEDLVNKVVEEAK